VIGRRKSASLGSEIVCVVKKTKPPSTLLSFQTTMQNKVKKGDVVRAVVCRVRKETGRRDGSTIRYVSCIKGIIFKIR
jgi:ribosomal protein L14